MPTKPHSVAAIAGAGEALQVSRYIAKHQCGVLFIARSPLAAYHLTEELALFAPQLPARYLPDWETLPYDNYSPTADIAGKRITALAALLDATPGITITTAAAAILPCAPPSYIAARTFALRVGDTLNLTALQTRLQTGGYVRTDRVQTSGEYALYGGQIDIYPPDTDMPLRIVLADDQIEQIRLFDSDSQRSVKRIDSFAALPAGECDLSAAGRATFAKNYDAFFEDDRAKIRRRVQQSDTIAGIEYYLPLFYDTTATLFDYLPPATAVIAHDNLQDTLAAFLHQARLRQRVVSIYDNRPTLPADSLFMSEDTFTRRLSAHPQTILTPPAADTAPPPVAVDMRADNSHAALFNYINEYDGTIILVVGSEGRSDALLEILHAGGISAKHCRTYTDCLAHKLSIITAQLRSGFVLPQEKTAVITEAEIYQITRPPRARRAQSTAPAIAPNTISAGDYVVHRDYGVGKAHGLTNMTVDGKIGEYLEIEYAGTQRLFLPVSQLHLLEIHHGSAELSKMGSRGWKRTAARAAKRAGDTAARLLEINARRAAARVAGHKPDATLLAKFISNFVHADTPDQQRAADEVLADLTADKPMDRLVAADVGFGKTEVAMRAAAAVAFGGRQAVLMAPTTLLAQQHHNTFCDRFARFPVKIGALSRFTTAADKRRLLQKLAAGDIDIVIGTHALLNSAIKYKNLGLIIIDEEHRFGVTHKEKLKNLRAGSDMLALSATPIPRTLAMALGGVRELSIISTPPTNRLQVKTTEAPFSHSIIVEACERELLRGGQIFFIHNEISSITDMHEQLTKWLPQARILTAHGGMRAAELEDIMRRFLHRQGDILLCTTIVESGLDISNANTIIINRADKMGLSRLHQLRGRVGRSSVQAYAYFLRPQIGDISKRAEMRLAAASDYSALGGGFFLSMRDLEIRGAGEILGERQSGDIEAVGCALYQRMVNSAAKKLRGEPDINTDISDAIHLSAPALLPADYIPSPAERMRYYRRLTAATDTATLNDIYLEWEDRFGRLPAAAQLLKESHRLRLLMIECCAEALRINATGDMTLKFAANPPCSERLVEKITTGACHPHSENAIKKALQETDPLKQALQAWDFLKELVG